MAKEVATLDFYSGGHVLFGIGAGWLADETEIFGVEFRKCWPVTREYVAAMKRLWTEPQASYEGEFVKFPPVCGEFQFRRRSFLHIESRCGVSSAARIYVLLRRWNHEIPTE